jgi:predicted O-methyltransferase YrrM
MQFLIPALFLGGMAWGLAPSGRQSGTTSGTVQDRQAQAVIDEVDRICRRDFIYMIGPQKAARLASLVAEKKPLLVVECGTAIGYSGLWIARELKAAGKGRLITIEIDEDRARIARDFFRKAGLSDFIESRVGDARQTVRALHGPVDFLFLDCNYSNYYPCFAGIEAQLAVGAVVVADNVGIGAASTSDYLGLVRSKYQSHTEWFDIDLPWGQRDAMEITTIRPRDK